MPVAEKGKPSSSSSASSSDSYGNFWLVLIVLSPFVLFPLLTALRKWSESVAPLPPASTPAPVPPSTTTVIHHHHHHHHHDQGDRARGSPTAAMSWTQKQFTLPGSARGAYLVTEHVVASIPELASYKVGLLHLFTQHTSCGLTLNENWDEDVRADMSDALDRIAPEDRAGKLYRHSAEGLDDMPAHIKASLVGSSVTVPIVEGKLGLGTWQGIWYCEFRKRKHERRVVATIQGEKY